MTLYKAVRNIPDGPNNPSIDQPKMKLNNNSFIDLIDVDHYGYNQANGGYHEIIHQPPEVSDPAAIPGIGQTYTKTVNGDQELFYESGNGVINQLTNGSGILPRAAVSFTIGPLPTLTPVIQNSFNVTSVTKYLGQDGAYVINFTNPLASEYYYPAITAQPQGVVRALVSNIYQNLLVPIQTASNLTIGITANFADLTLPVICNVIIFQ